MVEARSFRYDLSMRMPRNLSPTDDLLASRERHVARGIATAHPIFAVHALGAVLYDVEDREYLDFAAGIGVLAVGHNHPSVVEAAKAQLDRYAHTCFQVAMYELT